MNWRRLFKRHILDRGSSYFYDNAVMDLNVQQDMITAIVCGTEEYDINIQLNDEKIIDMNCSCPYAESGENCKHMAAVLFEWDMQNGRLDLEEVEEPLEVSNRCFPERRENIDDIVTQASEGQVKQFLKNVLRSDEKLLMRFRTFVDAESFGGDISIYKAQIDATIEEYLQYDDYIPYHEAYRFICEMEEILHNDVRLLIDNRQYLKAFELSTYLFIEVGNVDIDDSDGEMTIFANMCADIWKEILVEADDTTEEVMFKWFMNHTNGCVMDYMEEYLEDTLLDSFSDEKYVDAKLDYLDKRISREKNKNELWTSKYRIERWAMQYIAIMEEAEFSEERIIEYCKDNWEYSEIRKYYISKCLEVKDYEQAIDVLKESIQLDAGMYGLVVNYRAQLKDIYKVMGNNEAYRLQLWDLVTKDAIGDIDFYRELKSLYSSREWEKVREEVFALISDHSSIDKLYKEEHLYDRLLQYVLESPLLYKVFEHEKILKDHYPQELLQKYEKELREMTRYAADRKRYQEWVAILRRMKKIKGGKEKVEEIALHWKTVYRNRPAMMDELSRL